MLSQINILSDSIEMVEKNCTIVVNEVYFFLQEFNNVRIFDGAFKFMRTQPNPRLARSEVRFQRDHDGPPELPARVFEDFSAAFGEARNERAGACAGARVCKVFPAAQTCASGKW